MDGQPVEVCVAGRSHVGMKRSENQDQFLVADLSVTPADGGFLQHGEDDGEESLGRFAVGPKGLLLVVADGMGAVAGGRIASQVAAAWIYREMVARWGADRNHAPQQFAARLKESVEAANARVHDQACRNPEYQGMGTTATVAGVLDGFVYVAQVGDSRAYLVRRGAAVQITRDQSLVQQLVEAGTLTEEAAANSRHGNLLLQALGTQPALQVELTYQEIRRGDTLLLCSDGLFRLVSREEIAAAAQEAGDPTAVCERLIALANSRGGNDNVTVIAARLDGAGLRDPAAEDAVGRQVYALPDA